jgi:hypothetical protein
LIVEREPGDIDFTSALEDARWDVVAAAVVSHDDVGLECVVESFIGAIFSRQQTKQIEEESKVQQKTTN